MGGAVTRLNLVKSNNGRSFYASDEEIGMLAKKGLVEFGWALKPPAKLKVYRSLAPFASMWKVIPRYVE